MIWVSRKALNPDSDNLRSTSNHKYFSYKNINKNEWLAAPIPPDEATPLVKALVGLIDRMAEDITGQTEKIQQLRDEIAELKGQKAKPKFKPSGMNEKAGTKNEPAPNTEKKKTPWLAQAK